ncbi:MAG: TlpA disulfide reductase family protein [Myxococcota bacterium]
MRPLHRLFALLSVLSVAALAVVAPSPADARVGARPPGFSLPSIPGGPVSGNFEMSEYLGNDPVAIVFWATWCEPCKVQLPLYQQLYERYQEQGLKVVAIAMDGPETIARTAPVVRRLGLTFPVVSDLDTAVTSRLNPRRGAPMTVWVDRSGRIVYEREGFTLAERNDIARGISALVRRGASD